MLRGDTQLDGKGLEEAGARLLTEWLARITSLKPRKSI